MRYWIVAGVVICLFYSVYYIILGKEFPVLAVFLVLATIFVLCCSFWHVRAYLSTVFLTTVATYIVL